MSVSVIAEVGSVHDGSFGNALKLIDAVAATGADAVKFQTHIAEAETLRDAPAPAYFKGEPRFEYFQRTGFDEGQWRRLADAARGAGLQFISSPFSLEAVDLLERTGVDALKVASGEVSNVPLLERLAASGKPVILSSGMSTWDELDRAVEVLRGGGPLTVLQCSSAYPCPPEQVGLNVIGELRERYGVAVGYSDHADGPWASIAAVALGATTIEKHFTFSRLMYGSDAALAMEPHDFTAMVQGIRAVDAMLRSPVDKGDASAYREMKGIFEKSVVLKEPLPAGTVLDAAHLAFKKPGSGIPASRYGEVVGRTLARDVGADRLLETEDLA